MDAKKLEVIIELLTKGDTSKAVQELKTLEEQTKKADDATKKKKETVGKMEGSVASLAGKYLALGAVITASVSLVRSSISAFMEQEQAVAKLNGTLRASGQYTEGYSKDIQDLASALQDVTTYGDEAIIGVSTMLVSFGARRSEIPKFTEAVLNLATGLGIDLNSAAMMVGKALAGEFGTFSRFGFHIDENASKAEQLDSIMLQLEQRFGGLARASADTLGGALEKTKNSIGDLKELIGEFILTGLQPMAKELNEVAKGMTKAFTAPKIDKAAQEERQNSLRQSLEKELELREKLGEMSRKEADEHRTAIQAAFTPKRIRFTSPGPNSGINHVDVRNSEEIDKTLQSVFARLRPDLVKKAPVAGPEPERFAEERIKAVSDLRDLERKMLQESLSGFEKEKQAAEDLYRERANKIKELTRLGKITDEEELQAINGLNQAVRDRSIADAEHRKLQAEHAAARKKELELERQAIDQIKIFEQQLTGAAIGTSEKRSERIEREFAARLALYDELLAKGLITEQKLAELRQQAGFMRMEGRASLVSEGRDEIDRLNDKKLTPGEASNRQIIRLYEERRERLKAVYDYEIEQAQGNAERVQALESQKTAHFIQLKEEESRATSSFYQVIEAVGPAAAQSFSAGFSNAFVEFVRGTKDAEEAFGQFATSFLAQIAQMILQQMIFNAIKNSSFGGWLGLAEGGQAVPVRAAAAGIIAAANGVAGVSEVNSPTLFPKFNVLAGEAGREVLTVLSKPQLVNFNG
ncbi:MAG: phage tail tape measure C-terminal domain-containing protein, partial [Limisphaerales bacterium]